MKTQINKIKNNKNLIERKPRSTEFVEKKNQIFLKKKKKKEQIQRKNNHRNCIVYEMMNYLKLNLG